MQSIIKFTKQAFYFIICPYTNQRSSFCFTSSHILYYTPTLVQEVVIVHHSHNSTQFISVGQDAQVDLKGTRVINQDERSGGRITMIYGLTSLLFTTCVKGSHIEGNSWENPDERRGNQRQLKCNYLREKRDRGRRRERGKAAVLEYYPCYLVSTDRQYMVEKHCKTHI